MIKPDVRRLVCLWGGNRYTYTLPVGTIIVLFSSETQFGNENIQISCLSEKNWKIPTP